MGFLLGVFLICCLSTASANDECKKLDIKFTTDGTIFDNTDNIYKVGGEGRLQFYSAPDKECSIKGVFVVPGDKLYAYVEYGGYYSVMFIDRNGEQVTGWVEKTRLIDTHTGVGPSYDTDK